MHGLELIGPNAHLLAGLAYVYCEYANRGLEGEEFVARAEQCAQSALELDPESAEAHMVLGKIFGAFLGDQRASFRHLRAALHRKPEETHALRWLIIGCTIVGKTEEAELLVRRLCRADPLTPRSRYLPVDVSIAGGRFGHTVDTLTQWCRSEPESASALFLLRDVSVLRESSRRGAVAVGRTASHRTWLRLAVRAHGCPHQGAFVEPCGSRAHFTLERTARLCPQLSYFLADLFSLSGHTEKALDWLEHAVKRGFSNYPFMAAYDPLLASIRSRREFERIAAQAKEEWLRFSA